MGSRKLYTFQDISRVIRIYALPREAIRMVQLLANKTNLRLATEIAGELHRINSRKKKR